MQSASILVPAYNEEQNIGPLLRRIVADARSDAWSIDDIIVIASGCTDRTVERAREVAAEGAPVRERTSVRVIEQARREGKASAINVGLSAARHDVVLLASSDVLPEPGALQALLRAMEAAHVGVAGARPLPMNSQSTFTGFAAHLMWELHHLVSLQAEEPKCGELIAFRRALNGEPVVPAIPVDSAVDEVSIQALAHAAGLHSVYVPEAVVRNWGPMTVGDWFRQRRRINAGHILSAREGYVPATMDGRAVMSMIWKHRLGFGRPHWLASVVVLEMAARFRGRMDVARGHGHAVWEVATSAKRPIEGEAAQ
jgi:cellulose synthase/poly-beta-1,6-N-acetylglucosamine synthase-like glycosyltransferase